MSWIKLLKIWIKSTTFDSLVWTKIDTKQIRMLRWALLVEGIPTEGTQTWTIIYWIYKRISLGGVGSNIMIMSWAHQLDRQDLISLMRMTKKGWISSSGMERILVIIQEITWEIKTCQTILFKSCLEDLRTSKKYHLTLNHLSFVMRMANLCAWNLKKVKKYCFRILIKEKWPYWQMKW